MAMHPEEGETENRQAAAQAAGALGKVVEALLPLSDEARKRAVEATGVLLGMTIQAGPRVAK